MTLSNLEKLINRRTCTALGVGPMSKNCVDAVCEIANDQSIPIMLIASRRQIDAEQMGGGYVNNWSTEDFSDYVKNKDKKNLVILSRDHGGPWQNNIEIEKKYSLEEAMKSAKTSYASDIKSNFAIIHIDPSIDPNSILSTDKVLERVYELYDFCFHEAKKNNKEIIFEVGTEEQTGSTNTPDELEYTIDKINSFCDKNKFKKPSFVVIQSGTRVAEMRNIGSFDSEVRIKNELAVEIQVPRMIEICEKNNIWMKAHNTDYISDGALRSHPKLGIHAVNIAPEFGVIETKAIVETLTSFNYFKEREEFLEISFNSKKWDKWMVKNTTASDYDKSIISGHYVFSKLECIELLEKVRISLDKKNFNFDSYLKSKLKLGIMRYVNCLGMI